MSELRRPRYKLDENPDFKDGEIVEIDNYHFGMYIKEAEYIEGVIVGQQTIGNSGAPYWIVDFGDKHWFGNQKYRAIILPPSAIVKREQDLTEDEREYGEKKLDDLLNVLKNDKKVDVIMGGEVDGVNEVEKQILEKLEAKQADQSSFLKRLKNLFKFNIQPPLF